MHARVSWKEKRRFEAVADSNHVVTIDAKRDAGGEDQGPRPMELLLMGLGGCTGIDVTLILERMRIPYQRVDVVIDAQRAEQIPQKFTQITLTYEIDAPGAPLEKVVRAIKLSQEKYCSASHSISAPLRALLVLNGETHSIE
ncbi:hypothetical protein BM613_01210 [Sulfoacidibacillus thermotolerans]|uniref:Peroxiredoxin n=2 Tax=Sulfoacidibacillus thermotolerans TaxID=1765684 RepID=A0A2U3DBU0_SULT2|nr:hypothetical protein BM613_01210 [Sulfoacidibacillus thermotolerans]